MLPPEPTISELCSSAHRLISASAVRGDEEAEVEGEVVVVVEYVVVLVDKEGKVGVVVTLKSPKSPLLLKKDMDAGGAVGDLAGATLTWRVLYRIPFSSSNPFESTDPGREREGTRTDIYCCWSVAVIGEWIGDNALGCCVWGIWRIRSFAGDATRRPSSFRFTSIIVVVSLWLARWFTFNSTGDFWIELML